uniref:Cell death inducing DFFA like effector b n=1 Tax=Takifugu rubripes TaxID=31033 RepID=A0A674N1H7_TAKRU
GVFLSSVAGPVLSVTKRVWAPPQRPFRVCCHSRETRKGITAGTLEELKQKVCHALLLSLSAVSMSLVCEEDGTEVDSDDFLMTLPDNTMLMALQPGETWRPQPVRTEKRKVAPLRCSLSRGFRAGTESQPTRFGGHWASPCPPMCDYVFTSGNNEYYGS